jgi:hypothetical protein
MSPLLRFVALFQDVDEIPDEVVEELPPSVVQQLRDGTIDEIPENVIDDLSDSARDALIEQVPDFVPDSVLSAVGDNPFLAVVLALAGLAAIGGFLWGVSKSAMKAAGFFALVAALAWFLFLQQV